MNQNHTNQPTPPAPESAPAPVSPAASSAAPAYAAAVEKVFEAAHALDFRSAWTTFREAERVAGHRLPEEFRRLMSAHRALVEAEVDGHLARGAYQSAYDAVRLARRQCRHRHGLVWRKLMRRIGWHCRRHGTSALRSLVTEILAAPVQPRVRRRLLEVVARGEGLRVPDEMRLLLEGIVPTKPPKPLAASRPRTTPPTPTTGRETGRGGEAHD